MQAMISLTAAFDNGDKEKSSISYDAGECVLVGLVEGKSFSDSPFPAFQQLGEQPDQVLIGDSKHPHGFNLSCSPAGWASFITDVKAGRYDWRRILRRRHQAVSRPTEGHEVLINWNRPGWLTFSCTGGTTIMHHFNRGEWGAFVAGAKDGQFDIANLVRLALPGLSAPDADEIDRYEQWAM